MKYLLAQPAMLRFEWELDVVLTNILALDATAEIVCLLSVQPTETVNPTVQHIIKRYPTVSVHVYDDTRIDTAYPPTIRPFLWYCYLSEEPSREHESYFQIDSDVIFRELPDFSKIPADAKNWYGSDCSSYLDYNYLKSCRQGDGIVGDFGRILRVPRSVIEQTVGAGAQWVMVNPTAEYWLKVYNDSTLLYHYLERVDSNIQKWTAEMWAQLYNAPFFGITQHISPELDFCRPTDSVEQWNKVKILHNAGVVGDLAKDMFYKGKYVETTPFQDDLTHVKPDKASIKYVDAIKNVTGI